MGALLFMVGVGLGYFGATCFYLKDGQYLMAVVVFCYAVSAIALGIIGNK